MHSVIRCSIVTDEDLRGRNVLPSTCFSATCSLKNCPTIILLFSKNSSTESFSESLSGPLVSRLGRYMDSLATQIRVLKNASRAYSAVPAPLDYVTALYNSSDV